MAEIDAEELERMIRHCGGVVAFVMPQAWGVVKAAAEAHLAHLRAPKGELARAEAAALSELTDAVLAAVAWLDNMRPTVRRTALRDRLVAATEAANQAALSRARGEGT